MARSGQAAAAIKAVQGPVANPYTTAWNIYNSACCYAIASNAAELSAAEREAAAASAIQNLRRAIALDASIRWAFDTEVELTPLKHRRDYQALVTGQ